MESITFAVPSGRTEIKSIDLRFIKVKISMNLSFKM